MEAAVLRWRIMIDWLELDLHQTLKCAAGNYFVLERERDGGGERGGKARERVKETERGRERQRERHWGWICLFEGRADVCSY